MNAHAHAHKYVIFIPWFATAPQSYVICTLSVLFFIMKMIFLGSVTKAKVLIIRTFNIMSSKNNTYHAII